MSKGKRGGICLLTNLTGAVKFIPKLEVAGQERKRHAGQKAHGTEAGDHPAEHQYLKGHGSDEK